MPVFSLFSLGRARVERRIRDLPVIQKHDHPDPEGERLTRLEIGRGLLGKLSEEEIARLTGLPRAEIQVMRT